MPRPLLLPLVLRAALLAGLVALLLVGLRPADRRPGATHLTGAAADSGRLASALVDPLAPTAVLRDALHDPSEHELQALAAAAERAPLFVELPPERAGLRVAAPDRPLVDRFAAIRFSADAAPGDTVTVRLLDPGGAAVDSLRVAAGATGSAVGAVRVRPGRPEWTEWRVAVEGASVVADAAVAAVGAWVVAADPPRVLVVAGPPSWESRYVVRALERSGAEVSLVQNLGRDNVITAGDAMEDWASEESLGAHDVLVLLPGAAPDAQALAAIESWVAEGRGVLAASAVAGLLGLAPPSGDVSGGAARGRTDDRDDRDDRLIRGDSLVWSAPAEVAPLPPADLEAAAVARSTVPPGVSVAGRSAAGDPVLVIAPLGRGRAAGLGLRESWRWVMDAGLDAEHRAFWRSLVDWLAAPSADSLAVKVEPPEAAVGATVDVGLRGDDLELQRPGGGPELIVTRRGDGRSRGRFVAVDTGVHTLRADGAEVAAFRARAPDAAPPAELGRARLTLMAAASGGAALESEPFAARVDALGVTGAPPGRWLPWIFVALVLLALAEWSIRRLRGLP